jgi:2-iminobutanoate/2-iminopropanoate deaminase
MTAGPFVFISGQGPLDPVTGEVIGDDVGTQTRATLENVARVLATAGASLVDVVRDEAYLADISQVLAYDDAFRATFGDRLPTRTTVGAALGGIEVEITAIAYLEETRESSPPKPPLNGRCDLRSPDKAQPSLRASQHMGMPRWPRTSSPGPRFCFRPAAVAPIRIAETAATRPLRAWRNRRRAPCFYPDFPVIPTWVRGALVRLCFRG